MPVGFDPIASNPFAALTMVAAPAILTNASSVLAMSTSNRFLRSTERMHALRKQLEEQPGGRRAKLLHVQVPRVEQQALLLLRGLGWAYIGLGSFAAAALVSLIGATLGSYPALHRESMIAILGALFAGLIGVSSLVAGSLRLYQATRLSMLNIVDEAACIREERAEREGGAPAP